MKTALKMTLAERDRLPEDGNRYELIDGELYVTPSPIARHQRIVTRLVSAIDAFATAAKLGEVYTAPFDVHLRLPGTEGDTVVEPDVLFISKARLGMIDQWVYGAPDLVVEVLSESTARADLYHKRDAYRAAGVPEYWVVDPDRREVRVYRFAESAQPQILTERDTLTTPQLPGLELQLASIFS